MTPVTLSDGAGLPKGATIGIPALPMHISDNTYTPYENPDMFNGRRFLGLRQKDNDIKWQFVTTSPEQFGFGHGKQAGRVFKFLLVCLQDDMLTTMCSPGRFFASNETTLLTADLLFIFDRRFDVGDEPSRLSIVENGFLPDVRQLMWVKVRVPEMDLSGL